MLSPYHRRRSARQIASPGPTDAAISCRWTPGAAIEALGERLNASETLAVQVEIDLHFDSGRSAHRLVSEIEDTAYRLVQEALNNAAHHGETDRALVEVSESDGALRLRVSDEGRGFDPDTKTEGFGLIGMRERVSLAGGTLEVQSSPGNGTAIVAVLPALYPEEAEQASAESG